MSVCHEPGDRPLIRFPDLRWAGRLCESNLMTLIRSARYRPLIAGLSFLLPLTTIAANNPLGTINITASREAPAVAPAMPETVITRDEIERSQARSLQDLLAGRAGLIISNEGGPGKLSNISIWGQAANRTAVFLDGVRIGSVSAGASYLEHIPLAQIERIEIVRGPRSGQWGADAGGGVVQIFTRKNTEDGTHLSGGIGAGSRGYREADAHIGGRQGAFDYSLGISHQETDGFDARSSEFTDPDADGYDRDSAQFQAGYRFGDGGYVRGNAIASSADVDFDGYSEDTTEIEQRTFGLSSSTGRIGFWQLRARAGRHIDDQDNYIGDFFSSRFDTQRDTLFIASDFFIWPATTVTVGADQTYDKLASTTDYQEDSRRNQALFAQVNTKVTERLDLQGALRRDFNEQFGTANTGSLDLSYALTQHWKISAGYGESYTNPSFNDLYFPTSCFSVCYESNADLNPERTRTSRIGIRVDQDRFTFGLTTFHTDAKDLISNKEIAPNAFQLVNIDESQVRGVELEGSWSYNRWNASASATYLSTEDKSDGSRLLKQPRWSGRLDVDREFGAYSVGTTLHGQSNSEGGQYAEDNQGFVTADLRGAYRINADWRIETLVENVFDRDYQVVHGYNQAPRGVFVSLRYGR